MPDVRTRAATGGTQYYSLVCYSLIRVRLILDVDARSTTRQQAQHFATHVYHIYM